ncbi:MAG: riboflavin synthase [Cyclobacteriaceae bacterium]
MFTGIIEGLGKIERIVADQTNKHFCISSPVSSELKIDQSVCHNGVCLTVTKVEGGSHWVIAVDETLKKTTLANWKEGAWINLERSMPVNGRFDGHLVQGHVDLVGMCTGKKEVGGSWLFDFQYDADGGHITVEKGSICIDGVSLTCFNTAPSGFSVTIIPYTFENTNFRNMNPGNQVNLEFDIIGKYIQRLIKQRG